jgi:hypothetical protein
MVNEMPITGRAHKSDVFEKLPAALIKAQSEFAAVPFDATNPFMKNKYATLGALIDATRPILSKHGLGVVQSPFTTDAGNIGVETIIIHESGEWISGELSIATHDEKGKSAAQLAGSTITYLRRYSYGAFFGLYGDEDDDGNSAPQGQQNNHQNSNGRPAQAPREAQPALIEPGDVLAIKRLAKEAYPQDWEQTMLDWLKRPIHHIPAAKVDWVKAELQKTIAANAAPEADAQTSEPPIDAPVDDAEMREAMS